ncbi:hypothetical protein FXN65_15410 [Metapseudomonas lalkuanensis]|uniref:Uncharacterized protein n=1 Tax=Metapseudomonas lalkuanensis TaxID=2604832 RepID=A0A5J6QNT0_9GAMM|nr:hypothetical protein [Pseudomonas lalkuanensis]QEY63372.1 hypothetical protein FXN65_15410 [Pseudomonas lalkuanensis]
MPVAFAPAVDEFKEQDRALTLQHKIVLQESDSQEQLYEPLATKGFTFLARDLNFRAYKKGDISDPEATIPEPGVLGLNSYTTRLVSSARRGIGRLELVVQDGYFRVGLVTYPDYFAFKNSVLYAIELKTPKESTFKAYMSDSFWTDRKFDNRSIVDEMKYRIEKLPKDKVMHVLLFDLRNMTRTTAASALEDLSNSVSLNLRRKDWFTSHINSVMFFDGKLSKLISMTEILAGETSKGEQQNLGSFFTRKPPPSSSTQPPPTGM